MIEIVSIITQLIFFLVIFSFPFNPLNLNKILNLKKGTLNLIDAHVTNILFFIYFCLFSSFLNFDLKLLFKFYIVVSASFFLFNFKKNYFNFERSDILNFIIFILLIFSIFLLIAQNLKLEWDGHVWIQKAIIFFNNEKLINLNQTIHPDYPFLGSYLWAFFWKNSLLELEYLGRFFYIYFYVVSIFFIASAINIKNKNIKILLVLFLILITFETYYFGGYQEYLIFSSLLVVSKFIFILSENGKKNIKIIFLIFLILYLNTWFKNEGSVYLIIFFIPLLYFLKITLTQKILFIFLTFLSLIFNFVTQKYIIQISGDSGLSYLINFLQNFGDLKLFFLKFIKIFSHIIIAFIKHPLWLIFLFSLFFQIFILKKFNFYTKFFVVSFILNLLVIFGVYLSLGNIDSILRITLDRVLFQTSGLYLMIFICIINQVENKFYK